MGYQALYEACRAEVYETIPPQKESGIYLGYFYALMNITQELLPINPDKSIEDIWLDHLAFLKVVDRLREQPELYTGWDEIEGHEYVDEILTDGGVFLTWHYGFVRHIMEVIVEALHTKKNRSPFYQVVDGTAFKQEKSFSYWDQIRQRAGVQLINSEQQMIGLQLYKILKNKGAFSLYLDGFSGYNTDNTPISLPFLSSEMQTRSGIFRILQQTGAKACPVVMSLTPEGNARIKFHKPIQMTDNLSSSCERVYAVFREAVRKQPEQWRLWDRHHMRIVKWHASLSETPSQTQIDWFSKYVAGEMQLGINLKTGTLYELEAGVGQI
ncbi:hypothetical protein IC620_10860 [Hazenella sp. IB182357]|uniref:Uncharacterized protein n=1 Tax=Polycladospora coralii TaxID=2771432 RepID=A0A926RXU3_9BACL|nr:hypothetical protein [Polycladospora coralii]MBD1372856.1 hypothetical protein [Polycladospora coralii]